MQSSNVLEKRCTHQQKRNLAISIRHRTVNKTASILNNYPNKFIRSKLVNVDYDGIVDGYINLWIKIKGEIY
ncbi:hypothetical protein [Pectinatus brassicae]|uniref:Uncharacterized protein n=1 Tax=Pectinatus brassicae TaxID=862415 RepID=A0A840UV16_9FIRM|nr:hypothetical protein [Pectinatus brassicae]MBB5336295.1 hypothetical protein [Pectinatus brassicae]